MVKKHHSNILQVVLMKKHMTLLKYPNKIIHWKPSSLSYSRKELTKLTKKDIISLLKY